jgi:hypothetical protein
MIDENFRVYLIEINTNPCLNICCPLLSKLIPNVVDNTFRLAVDPLFPPPENFSAKKNTVAEICSEIKYELVFDSRIDGAEILEKMKERNKFMSKVFKRLIL